MPRAPLIAALLGVLALLSYPLPIAWLGLLDLLALAALRWRTRGRPFPSSPFGIPLGLYLAGAAVGLYATVKMDMALVRLFGLLAACGALFLVLDGVRSAAAARRLIGTVLVMLLVVCLLVLVLVAPQLRLDRLPGRLDWLPGLVGSIATVTQPLRAATVEVEGVGQRYRFTTAGLGILATYGFGMALGPLLAGPGRRTRLLGGMAAAAFLVFMILPGNRTAILAAPLLPLVLLPMGSRRGLTGLLIAGAVACGGVALALWRGDSLLPATATDLGPVSERVEYWRNYLFLLGDFPLTGVGFGLRSVADSYQRRFLPVDPGFNHAHNMLLQSYLEQGPLGLLGLLGLLGMALVVGAQALRRADRPAARQAALAGSGAVLAMVVDGLTEIVPLTTVGMVLLFGAMGLVLAARRLSEEQEAEAPASAPTAAPTDRRRVAVGAAGLVVALGLLLLPAVVRAADANDPTDPRPLLARPFMNAASTVALNLGALELNKAMLEEGARGARPRHFEAADLYLSQAQQLDPNNLGAFRNRAQLAAARGAAADARRVIGQLRALAPEGDSPLEFQVGRLYRETGSLDQAVNAWSRVDPLWGAWSCSNPYMQYLRWGVELFDATRYESAEKLARAAIQAGPVEREPYRLLTASLVMNDGEQAAGAALKALARADPTNMWPYRELARLQQRAGRQREADDWRDRADSLRYDPTWMDQQRRLAQPRNCREFLPAWLSED